MRKIFLVLALLVASPGFAQVQNEPISVGSNLHGLACRVNESQTDLADTEADANFCAADKKGNLLVGLRSGTAGATNPIKAEDAVFTGGDATVVVGAEARSAVQQSVSNSGDVAPPSMDLGNRLIITGAPAGETIQGCSSAITTATTGTVISAVASKFSFITSWECTNTGGAATRVILEDGDGNDLANGLLAATTGYFNQGFAQIPTKPSNVNKAIQINVITAGSSTICCARGYAGVI